MSVCSHLPSGVRLKITDRIIQNILDMGTGTGIWAMYTFSTSASAIYKLTGSRDVADAHPEASVKGIDLSPIQPSWIPPNLKFEVDDYNLDWLDENKYDLVHARELLGTVPNWVEMYRKVLGYVNNHERKP